MLVHQDVRVFFRMFLFVVGSISFSNHFSNTVCDPWQVNVAVFIVTSLLLNQFGLHPYLVRAHFGPPP